MWGDGLQIQHVALINALFEVLELELGIMLDIEPTGLFSFLDDLPTEDSVDDEWPFFRDFLDGLYHDIGDLH